MLKIDTEALNVRRMTLKVWTMVIYLYVCMSIVLFQLHMHADDHFSYAKFKKKVKYFWYSYINQPHTKEYFFSLTTPVRYGYLFFFCSLFFTWLFLEFLLCMTCLYMVRLFGKVVTDLELAFAESTCRRFLSFLQADVITETPKKKKKNNLFLCEHCYMDWRRYKACGRFLRFI